jgi:hypothetical protein
LKGEDVGTSWSSEEGRGFPHYLITRREPTGFAAPYTFFRNGEGVVPVFCSDGAARRYLGSLDPEDGWHVRAFSPGELVSLLFAVHERVAWVLADPLPNPLAGRTPANDDRLPTVGRDEFIAQLVRR